MKRLDKIFRFHNRKTDLALEFVNNGRIPWSKGYNEYKWQSISSSIKNENLLDSVRNNILPTGFGFRIDERVIEYPWIFSNLNSAGEKFLDAGSTFNFKPIIDHPVINDNDLTIFTFSPEKNNYVSKGISYVFGDLRNLPFKDNLFQVVVSQSTIEHIDMDNSIYGYDINHNEDNSKKSYEYVHAVCEMKRVLKSNGMLLLTFPYGEFENHGFFQQFDEEMLNRISSLLESQGKLFFTFFKYHEDGWRFASKDELRNSKSYNPHTGKGKQSDNAAHCRGIACLKFIKN